MQDLKSTSTEKPRFDPGDTCETTAPAEEADVSHARVMLSALGEEDEASSGKAPDSELANQEVEIPTAEPHEASAADDSKSQEAYPAVSLEETMGRLETCLDSRQDRKDGHCKNNLDQLGRQTALKRPAAAPKLSAKKKCSSTLVGASAKAKAGSLAKRPATQQVKAPPKKAVSGQKAHAKAAPKKKPGPCKKKSGTLKMTKKDVYSRQYHKSMSLSS